LLDTAKAIGLLEKRTKSKASKHRYAAIF